MGVPGMIASVPCVADKVTLKTAKRIMNIMREKRARGLGGLSVFCTVPKAISCQRRDCLPESSVLDTCWTSVYMLIKNLAAWLPTMGDEFPTVLLL